VTKQEILKDAQFEKIAETRVDVKHRVALGRIIPDQVTSFKVYQNAHGQIILDPLVSIPAHETWLFGNKKAAALVRRGLDDAKHRRLTGSREDYSAHLNGDA